MTLAELVAQLESRAAEAEALHASAPLATVYRAVLSELAHLNEHAASTPPAALNPPAVERHLTPAEVATLLQLPPAYAYRHARQLGGVKIGKYLRFPESAIRRRLERSR